MSIWRHARAILLLPGMVTLVIPGLLVWATGWLNLALAAAPATLESVGRGSQAVTYPSPNCREGRDRG